MKYEDQPWKKKVEAERQAVWARMADFRRRGVKMSDKKPPYKHPPDIYHQGSYHCPECETETQFSRIPGGTHVCPACDWWYAFPEPYD